MGKFLETKGLSNLTEEEIEKYNRSIIRDWFSNQNFPEKKILGPVDHFSDSTNHLRN
jgi:hypothetical protein